MIGVIGPPPLQTIKLIVETSSPGRWLEVQRPRQSKYGPTDDERFHSQSLKRGRGFATLSRWFGPNLRRNNKYSGCGWENERRADVTPSDPDHYQ